MRTCSVLMNLLTHASGHLLLTSMSSTLRNDIENEEMISAAAAASGGTGTAPSADDLLPILVFVIIKSNPPNLLSTIQFVDNFYTLESEEEYWWTLFSSAIEFIKTMN